MIRGINDCQDRAAGKTGNGHRGETMAIVGDSGPLIRLVFRCTYY